MSMDLYTAATPNGWKASIMVEELREAGVELPEFRIHELELMEGEQKTPEYTAINPNQKIPTLVDDGLVIIESCAILQYLAEKYPSSLLPMERKWEVIPWLYWQAANLGPNFGNKLSYTRYMPDVPDAAKAHPLERFERESLRLTSILNLRLAAHPWLCGDEFTVADIACYPWVRAYKWSKIDITRWPRVTDWVERARARPGVERGIAHGVPKEEIDKFSSERRALYKRRGAAIASNESLKPEI